MKKYRHRKSIYNTAIAATFACGLTPFLFNWVVDPYGMNNVVDLDLNKFKVSERAHYPLWKMINFPKEGAEIVILGDSRARALRQKIWTKLGVDTFNFAYGGATIDEIYDTFEHVKNYPKLKTLVVSLPLRSFDPDHRGGLNRVPEAIQLAENPVRYYKSWFVARMGMNNLRHRYPAFFEQLHKMVPTLVSPADAASLDNPGQLPLTTLLNRDLCEGCALPAVTQTTAHPSSARKINLGLGRGYGHWERLWTTASLERTLPKRFEKQVRKNGANDWGAFKFSEDLWGKIETIARWSDENNVKLVFVIPPTIVEMQERMASFGFADLNHRFRVRLAQLAPVFDFDFNSPLTRDLKRFTDAYHFKAKPAHAIVGELVHFISQDQRVMKRALKKRGNIICPLTKSDISRTMSDDIILVEEGKSCRVWRWSHG